VREEQGRLDGRIWRPLVAVARPAMVGQDMVLPAERRETQGAELKKGETPKNNGSVLGFK
jgi:hypothetical protein